MFLLVCICCVVVTIINGVSVEAASVTSRKSSQMLRASFEKSRVALLIFGDAQTALPIAARLRQAFMQTDFARVIDGEIAVAAARGAGYTGSLNLTIEEARDIGAAIGCDFILFGDAQTIRRSSSATPVYYEAYASMFLVDARNGKLIAWRRPHVASLRETEATGSLLSNINVEASALLKPLQESRANKSGANANALDATNAADDARAVSDADSFAASIAMQETDGYREPQPYRRISPAYTAAAYAADAEATVDAQADIDETGEVVRVEIVRWAGFDLDEAVAQAIKAMHFRPAQFSGKAIRSRVLLRYNFRRPPRRTEGEQQEPNLFAAPV